MIYRIIIRFVLLVGKPDKLLGKARHAYILINPLNEFSNNEDSLGPLYTKTPEEFVDMSMFIRFGIYIQIRRLISTSVLGKPKRHVFLHRGSFYTLCTCDQGVCSDEIHCTSYGLLPSNVIFGTCSWSFTFYSTYNCWPTPSSICCTRYICYPCEVISNITSLSGRSTISCYTRIR